MEIERKFLLNKLPEDLKEYPFKKINQSYISVNPVIRIRKEDEKYILTIKGKGHISREEKEIFISAEEYENLYKKKETKEIVKKRYLYPLKCGLEAEIDIYEKNLSGLITAEVEFKSIEEAEEFHVPSFFGEDVSFDPAYKNANLAIFGKPEKY